MVSFESKCRLRFRDTEYTSEDVANAWYTEKDIIAFKDERKVIKQLVKSLGSVEMVEKTMGDSVTCQGLEKYISKSKTLNRKERIQKALHAVYKTQQEELLARNMSPEEAIAKAYQKATKGCQKEANIRALVNMAKTATDDKQAAQAKQSQQKATDPRRAPVGTKSGQFQSRLSIPSLRERQ